MPAIVDFLCVLWNSRPIDEVYRINWALEEEEKKIDADYTRLDVVNLPFPVFPQNSKEILW